MGTEAETSATVAAQSTPVADAKEEQAARAKIAQEVAAEAERLTREEEMRVKAVQRFAAETEDERLERIAAEAELAEAKAETAWLAEKEAVKIAAARDRARIESERGTVQGVRNENQRWLKR